MEKEAIDVNTIIDADSYGLSCDEYEIDEEYPLEDTGEEYPYEHEELNVYETTSANAF